MKRSYWLIIPAFVFALYWRALGFELAADDWYWHSLGNFNWGLVFGYDSMLVSGMNSGCFRPIPQIIIGILIDLKAQFWLFHLHNLVIHALNGVLVFFLIRHLFYLPTSTVKIGKPITSSYWENDGYMQEWVGLGVPDDKYALFGALLYVALPYHTDPVTWISGVYSLYLAMFAILMVFALLQKRMALAFLAMVGAILSHEMGFALCLVVPWFFKDRFYKAMKLFWGGTAAIWLIHYHIVGGIGIYGWKFYLPALNPINWIIFCGYYLKWLIP